MTAWPVPANRMHVLWDSSKDSADVEHKVRRGHMSGSRWTAWMAAGTTMHQVVAKQKGTLLQELLGWYGCRLQQCSLMNKECWDYLVMRQLDAAV